MEAHGGAGESWHHQRGFRLWLRWAGLAYLLLFMGLMLWSGLTGSRVPEWLGVVLTALMSALLIAAGRSAPVMAHIARSNVDAGLDIVFVRRHRSPEAYARSLGRALVLGGSAGIALCIGWVVAIVLRTAEG